MILLDKISTCNEDEIDLLVDEEIKKYNKEDVSVKLGFSNEAKAYKVYKGFMPLNTRIRYSNISIEDYGMQTTDFIYEFAHLVKKNNASTKASLIINLETFINYYFGIARNVNREDIFYDVAWKNTKTDEEFFEALKNNQLGDLKHMNAAECTERSALAQQILSIFGLESYYCIGCISYNGKQECHCFNIVKRKNDYALLDYSVPVIAYDETGKFKSYYPFIGNLTNEEFIDFIENGSIKSFDEYHIVNKEIISDDIKRKYVVNRFEIEKENIR